MADSHPSDIPTQRFGRTTTATERIREVTFPIVAMRGYDRRAVDEFVEQMIELVSELEGRQSREAVVQRALDEVGEETAGILQRAHETADEIAARSRAQAEGRLQRAEREADIMRRDADVYAEQVVVDTRLLWEERQRLIDDIRQLADEVLATADDAIERVKMPEPLRAPDAAAADSPTTEVELDLLPGGAAEGTDELEALGADPGEDVPPAPPQRAEPAGEPREPAAEPPRDEPGPGKEDPLADSRRMKPRGE
jgi:DivIVA domain-containing protein